MSVIEVILFLGLQGSAVMFLLLTGLVTGTTSATVSNLSFFTATTTFPPTTTYLPTTPTTAPPTG